MPQIRRGERDESEIISNNTHLKHMLQPIIRTVSPRPTVLMRGNNKCVH